MSAFSFFLRFGLVLCLLAPLLAHTASTFEVLCAYVQAKCDGQPRHVCRDVGKDCQQDRSSNLVLGFNDLLHSGDTKVVHKAFDFFSNLQAILGSSYLQDSANMTEPQKRKLLHRSRTVAWGAVHLMAYYGQTERGWVVHCIDVLISSVPTTP